jgi:hypothetical protein
VDLTALMAALIISPSWRALPANQECCWANWGAKGTGSTGIGQAEWVKSNLGPAPEEPPARLD